MSSYKPSTNEVALALALLQAAPWVVELVAAAADEIRGRGREWNAEELLDEVRDLSRDVDALHAAIERARARG